MSDHTAIEWTDATWSPITGCSAVSEGCRQCYAAELAGTRLKHHGSRDGLTRKSAGRHVWTGEVRFNAQWLDQPVRWKKPRRIFVCAHADLFHENVPDAWIDQAFAVMALAPQHTFQVLTKRPERMRDYVSRGGTEGMAAAMFKLRNPLRLGCEWPLPNVWLGVSAENQAAADERIPLLLETPAAVRWVSVEPMLGPVDFTDFSRPYPNAPGLTINVNALTGNRWEYSEIFGGCPPDDDEPPKEPRLHWVVCGGESGPHARPMHPDWARSLRDQCQAAGVPFLFKQWGAWAPVDFSDASHVMRPDPTSFQSWVRGTRGNLGANREQWQGLRRMDKKAAGRLLDGRLHDEYPMIGGSHAHPGPRP